MALPECATTGEKVWYVVFRLICAGIFLFLIGPLLVIIPLSFNAEPYFTFTPEMLSFNPDGFSLRWYEDFFTSDAWQQAVKNSVIVAIASTVLATVLGTVAALGLSSRYMPYKDVIMAIMISPMIVPLIISAAAMFFFFSRFQLTQTYIGVILAHTALGIPFVVITVTATLSGFGHSLTRASASLGANPVQTFFKVVLPLVTPGVFSGALFAFITSFDEVVVVLFISGPQQTTLPIQMWSGIREEISPTILAAASLLVALSIALLTTLEFLRRRSAKMRGIEE